MSKISPHNIYKLVQNDKGEIMIIIYTKDPLPQNATFSLNQLSGVLKINRTKEDTLIIAGLDIEAIHKLSKIKQLYVCEIKYKKNSNDDNEIAHTYIATLQKEKSTPRNSQAKQEKISQKVKIVREKALKKTAK